MRLGLSTLFLLFIGISAYVGLLVLACRKREVNGWMLWFFWSGMIGSALDHWRRNR